MLVISCLTACFHALATQLGEILNGTAYPVSILCSVALVRPGLTEKISE